MVTEIEKKRSRKLYFTDNLYRRSLWRFWWPCKYITDFLIIFSLAIFALVHRKTYQIRCRLFLIHANLFEGAAFHSFQVLKEIIRLFARTFGDIQLQGLCPILSDEGFGSWIVDFKQVSSLNIMLNYWFKGLFLL